LICMFVKVPGSINEVSAQLTMLILTVYSAVKGLPDPGLFKGIVALKT